ncbi:MAG: Ppx/GppA phosphatase family protein [Candidatus Aureabacteria bacterium]|nr:Ppx/GppA phosphatase family protein [Candidatus Auribacterota bacterium]
MRVCAIDVGSNSVRCLIADIGKEGRITPVDRALRITRLGEGMGRRAEIIPEAARRTLGAVEECVARGTRLGSDRFTLFGTAALREASNASSFIAVLSERTGQEIKILSGDEEALLAFRGATSSLSRNLGNVLVIDIGGGSTEFIRRPAHGSTIHTSLPLGCVRLTERFIQSDPPSERELAGLSGYAATLFSRELRTPPEQQLQLIGAGGTITTAATLSLGLTCYDPERIHGSLLSRQEVVALTDRLARMRLAERKLVPGIEEERADIIVGGLVILREIMDFFRCGSLTVSDHGILHGAILELAQLQ